MAVYGFTDAELRRTELIGNRTVRRRDLLELLDTHGCFDEGDQVTGKASTDLQVLGIQAHLVVDLSYYANPLFLSGVAEEIWSTPGDENDMHPSSNRLRTKGHSAVCCLGCTDCMDQVRKGWLARTGTNMRLFLEMLVNTHVTAQADRLRRSLIADYATVLRTKLVWLHPCKAPDRARSNGGSCGGAAPPEAGALRRSRR